MKFECSECGKSIDILYISGWKYKTVINKSNTGTVNYSQSVQCSYTCYDHALLRKKSNQSNMSSDTFKKEVSKSESAMKAQGKEVLHPINIKNKKARK